MLKRKMSRIKSSNGVFIRGKEIRERAKTNRCPNFVSLQNLKIPMKT